MIRRVLCPFDGSASSRAALQIAASTSGIVGAKLTGLFVEDAARLRQISLAMAMAENLTGQVVTEQLLPPKERIAEEERIERESIELYAQFQERCEEAKIEGMFLSLRGEPADVIAKQSEGADLVVMGRNGLHQGVEGRHSGDTIRGLLKLTTAPVIAVPDDARGGASLVICYDGSRASQRALRTSSELAELAELDDVHLVTAAASADEGNEILAPAIRYLGEYDVDVYPRVLEGDPSTAILEVVREVEPSFVALGAFGGNRIRELIFGSTTEHVMHGAPCAVILVP